MKQGLLDEDILEGELVKLFEESSGPPGPTQDTAANTTFVYDNDSGKVAPFSI